MAEAFERLLVRVEANAAAFERDMKKINRALYGSQAQTKKSLDAMDRATARGGQQMVNSLKTSLAQMAPVIAGAFSAAAVLKYADAYTALQNRLKATGLQGAALKQVEDSLYESANRNGVAVAATAELYQRAAMARNNLGASEEQLLALVSGTSAALKLQGTSAGEASGALLQLGQILGGQTVQAQEYNSLVDQLPVLLQAAANGSERFGGQISTLSAQVKTGKVTTQEFFAALLKGLTDVEARAGAATVTVGSAFQTLNNEIGRYIGQTNNGLSATQRMAQAIIALSENLDTVALVVGAVATIMGARFVLAMTAGSGAMIANGVATLRLAAFQTAMTASMTGTTAATVISTGAMRAFSAAIAANPIGAAIIAIAALSAGVVYLSSHVGENADLNRRLTTTTSATSAAMAEYEKAARDAANATGENVARARDLLVVKAEEARKHLANAVALREETKAYADQLSARAQGRLSQMQGGLNRGTRTAALGVDAGLYEGAAAQAAAARQTADAARAAATAAQAEQARIQGQIANGGYRTHPVTLSADDKKPKHPTPEELARQREMLDLQAEIALLRAQDRDAEADARQDALDVLNLTKQYEDAGFANAKAKAETQVAALATAREAAKAAEESKRQAEGQQRAVEMTRGFVLEMLDVQEQLALTDSASLDVRRQILAIRQAERRAALETAAADASATEAERAAARAALAALPTMEHGENRALAGSSPGARNAQDIVRNLDPYADAVKRASDAYAEIDRMRTKDGLAEADAARAKAQIDNDLREQRLSGTRTMLDTLSSLQGSSNKKLAALGKAAAIAQATIDGVLAVQKALASAPPPFNFIQAAIVGAVAAANVASIAGMADGGIVRGVGGPRQDNQPRMLSVGEFVNTAASVRKNRAYLEAANNGADLSKMVGLANGGMVGRVNAAASRVASSGGRSAGSSITYSPTIDARGAGLGVERQIRAVLDEHQRALPGIINGVRENRAKYRLGGRK